MNTSTYAVGYCYVLLIGNFNFRFTDIDDCDPNPCHNAGVCADLINGYTCDCTDQYMGQNCTEGIHNDVISFY